MDAREGANVVKSERVVTDLYTSDEYARRHPDWHREHSQWKADQVLHMLRRHGHAPRSVVEVGCGAGGVLAALQRELPATTDFLGYDIAAAALALARPFANEKLHFIQGDFLATSAPNPDLLLTLDVVEHVEDHLAFLRALRDRAAVHIIHLPLDLSLLSRMQPQRLRWARESVGHLHYFTKSTALGTVRQAGFRIVDWFYTAVELDQPPPAAQRQRLRGLRRIGRSVAPGLTASILGGFSLLLLCEPARQ